MRLIAQDNLLVLVPETDQEARDLETWRSAQPQRVFAAAASGQTALELRDIGPRPDACREPINVVSNSPDTAARLISNLAPTPFEMDGERYACVEAFWQSLKFADPAERHRIAGCEGPRALSEGRAMPYGATFTYRGEDIPVGTWRHWQLMEVACRHKFTQHEGARAALLSTAERPLQHIVRRDSRTIPGAIMADIWMRIRRDLRRAGPGTAQA